MAESVVTLLQSAVRHHQEGRLRKAEALYRQVLQQEPKNADGLHLLGLIEQQNNRLLPALELMLRSVALYPINPVSHTNLGETYRKLGQFDEAVASQRQAVDLNPNYAIGHYNLGVALAAQKLYAEAILSYQRVLEIDPSFVLAHFNKGVAYSELGKFSEAVAAYQRTLALQPDHALAQNNLGSVYMRLNQFDLAKESFEKSVRLQPRDLLALTNLCSVCNDLKFYEEARESAKKALALDPRNGLALSHLANAYCGLWQLEEARACAQKALELDPLLVGANGVLAVIYSREGRNAESMEIHRKIVALDDDSHDAHFNLGLGLLLEDSYLEGWEKYERRWKMPSYRKNKMLLPKPRWDGGNFTGQTLLLQPEQGLGDLLQMVRYFPMVKERGGQVLAACLPPLRRILQPVAGVDEWLSDHDPNQTFDLYCPIMSLPGIFQTTLEDIPTAIPYLEAEEIDVVRWKTKLADDPPGFRIGLVWAGNPEHTNDKNRSIDLSMILPLTEVGGATFYSLQIGPANRQLQEIETRLIDYTAGLSDMAETAALIANLDLVITVDTSVAHLAGAMGIPTWILVAICPDWRWGLHRQHSPWYPSVRLFRQTKPMEWSDPIERVGDALRSELAKYENGKAPLIV